MMKDKPIIFRPQYKHIFVKHVMPFVVGFWLGTLISMLVSREFDMADLLLRMGVYLFLGVLLSPIRYFLATIAIRDASIAGPMKAFTTVEIPISGAKLPVLPVPFRTNIWANPFYIEGTDGRKVRLDWAFTEQEIETILSLVAERQNHPA
ncbi:MAG: hypothetical protein HUU38_03625 [Anaerolineales bacterium]|nr:hypothetical protein [Anaerolineales bacterium]